MPLDENFLGAIFLRQNGLFEEGALRVGRELHFFELGALAVVGLDVVEHEGAVVFDALRGELGVFKGDGPEGFYGVDVELWEDVSSGGGGGRWWRGVLVFSIEF